MNSDAARLARYARYNLSPKGRARTRGYIGRARRDPVKLARIQARNRIHMRGVQLRSVAGVYEGLPDGAWTLRECAAQQKPARKVWAVLQ